MNSTVLIIIVKILIVLLMITLMNHTSTSDAYKFSPMMNYHMIKRDVQKCGGKIHEIVGMFCRSLNSEFQLERRRRSTQDTNEISDQNGKIKI